MIEDKHPAAIPVTRPSHPPTPAKSALPLQPQGETISPADQRQAAALSQGASLPELLLHDGVHTVQAGETLSTIAKQYLGSEKRYLEIFALNKGPALPHPSSILRVGQQLKVPLPAEAPSKKEESYYLKNPFSYLTLTTSQQGAFNLQEPDELTDPFFTASFLPPHLVTLPNQQVVHTDAVKVNKTFDLLPALTPKTMKAQLPQWASKVAEVLDTHSASVKISPTQTLNAAAFRQLAAQGAQATEALKQLLTAHGGAFTNTLWAIDDVVANMAHDPYYESICHCPKTIDLAAVAQDFQLGNDRLNYLGHLAAHRHRSIPVLVETANGSLEQASGARPATKIIADLAQHFNAKGLLVKPAEFEQAVYQTLSHAVERRALIQHFQLNSQANLDALIPGILSESGAGDQHRKYNSYFAVGAVILNRTLGRNLKQAARDEAKGTAKPAKPFTVRDIMYEQGQFEVTWRKVPGKEVTFFDYQRNLNKSFQAGKIPLGSDTAHAFELSYEVARDLLNGGHRLQAEVNGTLQKGSGRSAGDLFFFNQSRSKDFSRQANEASAVKLIDENNTHVFFTSWDSNAYFR